MRSGRANAGARQSVARSLPLARSGGFSYKLNADGTAPFLGNKLQLAEPTYLDP